ncbi:hypothetical protein BYT27DRAFT_7191367, partial [Phlegmacium glaucopus]
MCDSAIDQETLVKQLNTLLISLHIPIPLISPTDLTPRLLVAILESLVGVRLPINFNHELKDSRRAHAEKVQAMKMFLGVLETDYLQTDVGLSNLDPRRLADGEWEEVLFIANLLCWIGRQAGLISASDDTPSQSQSQPISSKQRLSPKSQLDLDAESLFHSGSTVTGIERSSERTFSPFLKEKGGDSVTSFEDQGEESMSDIMSDIHGFQRPLTNPPRCIHQVSPPSLLFSIDPEMRHSDRTPSPDHNWSFCDCHPSIANTLPIEHDHPNPQSPTSIRTTGFIQPVDEEAELASFESSRSMSFSSRHGREYSDQSKSSHRANQKAARIAAVHEQYMRTVHLLNERARLLTQLADFKNSNS